MKTRIQALLLAFLLSLSLLTGCGGGANTNQTEDPSKQTTENIQREDEDRNSNIPAADETNEGNSVSTDTDPSDDRTEGETNSDVTPPADTDTDAGSTETEPLVEGTETAEKGTEPTSESAATETEPGPAAQEPTLTQDTADTFDCSAVPAYSGSAYVAIHDNIPYFDTSSLMTESTESYADLDSLGRCGVAYACVGQNIMPTEERGSIGMVKPTGWHTVKYDVVDGKYLYNRCHLIGYQLTAENANTSNLITGTRYLNIEGMLPFENMTADYVKETNNHVAYRVTPVFMDDEPLARGVLMEGWSVEDGGDGVCFCVFAYNVQPGIDIDYATGESSLAAGSGGQTEEPEPLQDETPAAPVDTAPEETDEQGTEPQGTTYILNTNTKKFHYPDCSSVKRMKESNKQEYTGSREEIISQGYEPCNNCDP